MSCRSKSHSQTHSFISGSANYSDVYFEFLFLLLVKAGINPAPPD
jgi:hypothetical protein